MCNTTKNLYESPMKEKNLDKYGYIDNQCICCGKPMKEGNKLIVHMGTDWLAYNTTNIVLVDGVYMIEGTNTESQGFFEIGNDCAKKMIGFTFDLSI